MKQYDRESKKWVDEEVLNKKTKKRKLCKGGREHNFELNIPFYERYSKEPNKEMIEKYYELEDKRVEMDIKIDEELRAIGITSSRYRGHRSRFYVCPECYKHKYESY